MSNRHTNHNEKGITLAVRRPKSPLSKRRNKAKARVRREARRGSLAAVTAGSGYQVRV